MKKKFRKVLGVMCITMPLVLVGCTVSESNNTTENVAEGTSSVTEQEVPKETAKPMEMVKVYEDDNCTISLYKVEENDSFMSNLDISFRVQNKSSRTLTFQSDAIAINGESFNKITMSDEVAPNSNGTITASCDADLSYINLNEIMSVSGGFRIIDFADSSFDSYDAMFVNVPVSGGEVVATVENGIKLFEDDKIDVYFVGAEESDSFMGNVDVALRVTNKTDTILTVQA